MKAREIAFGPTPKGAALWPIVQLLQRRNRLKRKITIAKIDGEIRRVNRTFKRQWHEDAMELIGRVFGK